MTNGDFANLEQIQDIESHNVYALAKKLHIPKKIRWNMIRRTSRDNARTPMQWSSAPNAGFTTGTPWLQVNGNYKEVNVAADTKDPAGIFAFWQKMIALRKSEEALIDGDFHPVYTGKAVYAFERVGVHKRLLVLCNMTGKPAKLPKHLQDWDNMVISNYAKTSETTLQPFEFRMMEEMIHG